jgi:hypothetical protein
MARAVICNICGAASKEKDASCWRKLSLLVRGATGELHDGSELDGDDVCSKECAKQWWERRLRSVFR